LSSITRPSTPTTTSSAFKPAFSAGLSGVTSLISAPLLSFIR
jgi:hypothetical protein